MVDLCLTFIASMKTLKHQLGFYISDQLRKEFPTLPYWVDQGHFNIFLFGEDPKLYINFSDNSSYEVVGLVKFLLDIQQVKTVPININVNS